MYNYLSYNYLTSMGRIHYVCQVITFITIFSSYFKTIQKGIPGGDAGELVAEACLRGTAHPPGYPLFTMITSLAMHILPYKPAVSANIASALFGSFTGLFLYKSIFLFSRHVWYENKKISEVGFEIYISAMFGSYCFVFSNLTWLYSIGAEVFALNNMLTAWILYISILYKSQQYNQQKYSSTVASYAAFVCGLSLANQHTSIFYVIIIAFFVAYDVIFRPEYCSGSSNDKRQTSITCWRMTEVLKLSTFAVLGLSPYLYLPIAANTPKKGSWGDTSTLYGFFTHILRKEYGTFSLSPAKFQSEGLIERLQYYIQDAILQFHAFECMLMCIGMTLCFYLLFLNNHEGNKQLSTLIFSMFFTYILIFHSLSNLPLNEAMPFEVHRRFWMQPNLILCIWIGIGTSTIFIKLKNRICNNCIKSVGNKTSQVLMFSVYVLLSFITTARWYEQYNLMLNYYGQGPLGNYFERHGQAVLDSMPQNALLLSFTDLNWNSIRYLQECENKRLDVTHLNFQIMPFPWFEKTQRKLYNSASVKFPKISYSDASMQKGTRGHAKILTDFFMANLKNKAHKKRKVFVDLHAIGFDQFQESENVFQGLHYIPHGTVWEVKAYKAFKYNAWKKRLSRSMETVDKMLLPLPTKDTLLPGSWEEGCTATYIDSLYQTALFQLDIAVRMNVQNGKDAISLKKKQGKLFFHALFQSFEHLQRILKLVETSPHNLKMQDVYKNAALSASRMTTAMTWIDKVDKTVLPFDSESKQFALYPPYRVPELNNVILTSRNTIQLYLKHATTDPDAPVFRNHLNILNSIINSSGNNKREGSDSSSSNNRVDKMKKKKTKKKKKKSTKRKKRSKPEL